MAEEDQLRPPAGAVLFAQELKGAADRMLTGLPVPSAPQGTTGLIRRTLRWCSVTAAPVR